ncbi:hypothetical protein [Ellagibacter isourolithinifaciens]|uniref:VG15 protein n=1 Tax=Ellagibacter isourolithinifaciens TaxID=2137581 RepID=UPI003AADB1E6
MISAEEFREYNRGAAEIGDGAASAVEQRVLGWCRSHEDATVAEKREAAKLIMEGFVQAYDDKAAEFASQWYDYRAEQGGARLKQAVTMTVYEPGSVDDVARYQAKKLAKEGDAAFARACGEFARNDAFRSLNETIIANVGRDRDKGAMFARVPTGTETCTFCLMLASRGAVYHSRKTAGEWRHFHRGCDCKVVPSFESDPGAELVQGVKPRELYARYKQFKEIDETEGLSSAEKDELKRKILDGGKASERSVIRMLKSGEIEDASDVHVPTSSEVPNWLSGTSRNRHAKRHAAEYGIDYRSKDGQEEYNRIMSEVIDAADSVVLFDGIGGQNGQVCAVYFRGVDIAVVNIDENTRVTLFKYEKGRSNRYGALWDKVRERSDR